MDVWTLKKEIFLFILAFLLGGSQEKTAAITSSKELTKTSKSFP